MKEAQEIVKKFNDARGWSTPEHVKDLLLNMTEEIGEFWNLIKWVDAETQKKMIKENKGEVENFIGDMMFLVLKVAYLCDVDSKKAFDEVMAEYEKRFPAEQTKGRHANVKAGGIDLK
jgi:NTP pyrophosphatase (non-canonical NTP hydrolase)